MRCGYYRCRSLRLLHHVQCARRCLAGKIGHARCNDLHRRVSRGGRVTSSCLGHAGARHHCHRASADHNASTRGRTPGTARLATGRALFVGKGVGLLEADLSLAESLRYLEEKLLRPEVRRSAEAVAELLAEAFVEFGSSGRVYRREQIIEMLRQEPPVQRSLTRP